MSARPDELGGLRAPTSTPRIAVVDYGMGNRRSVEKALERVGASAFVSRDPAALRAADGLLLPGVGAFPAAMATIRELGLEELLRELAAAGMPLFGSCMGMQLLFERSAEHGGAEGLGLLRGEVRSLRAPGLKLPHIGWSEVRWRGEHPLREGLPEPSFLYHVHSFVAQPGDPEVVLATAEYGEVFPAVVGQGNVFGAQSHPEKSSTHGLALLGNFVAICAQAAGARGAMSAAQSPGLGAHSWAGGPDEWRAPMMLYPAIDILGGSAVRLTKGDFAASKVYDEDPLAAAQAWVDAGARRLHVVDLDGAREGRPVNLEHVRRIATELGVPVQVGGGLRTLETVTQTLAAGAARVILGTAAFTDPELLERALAQHGPERVLVSVDVRGGRVATAGWTQTTATSAVEAIASLRERGVGELVFTNVDRDGMLEGPDLVQVGEVVGAAGAARVLYSGGIGRLADLEALVALGERSLAGVIVGKALYERRFTVAEALAVLGE